MLIDKGPARIRPRVIVAGGGVAGLIAAHRLIERGYDVTLYESNEFLGGKLGAHRDAAPDLPDGDDPAAAPADVAAGLKCPECREAGRCVASGQALARHDWHEHCYHMYLNWYHNFWDVMAEAGAMENFLAVPNTNNIHRDEQGEIVSVDNVGSLWTGLKNTFSGLGSPPDLVLWGQAIADLIATAPQRADWLEKTSIMSFMTEKFYMTEQAMAGTYRTTAQAFASPSYLSSSRSYRALMSYGWRLPEPQMWLLKANTETAIFSPWLQCIAKAASAFTWEASGDEFLNAGPFKRAAEAAEAARAAQQGRPNPAGRFHIKLLTGIKSLGIDAKTRRVTHIMTVPFERTDQSGGTQPVPGAEPTRVEVPGDLILAVPLTTLATLVTPLVDRLAPGLQNVRNLRTEPMISLDLFFKRKLDNLPQGITVMLNSPIEMSFLDNSQTWTDAGGNTVLNVIASKADTIVGYSDQEVLDLMLEELRHYIVFDKETDIYHCRTHLQTNVGEALFVNEVGSWDLRPVATCGIRNLFIAGDYCQTPVDVVTIEGAAVSGLLAAEALRRRRGFGEKIAVRLPDAYPVALMQVLAGPQRATTAVAASVLSTLSETVTKAYEAWFPS